MSRLKFGVGLPQIGEGAAFDSDGFKRLLLLLESHEVDSVWVMEQVLARAANCLEPLPLLSFAGAMSERLRLGIAVLILPLHQPVRLAKELATLDQMSGGRLVVGVGLGGRAEAYPAFGVDSAKRSARFRESIEIIRLLWTEDSVSFQGEFWQFDSVTLRPKPIQDPHPPIWFGGHSEGALNRAAEIGDGWIGAGMASTTEFARSVVILQSDLGRSGRDFVMGKRVYVMVTSKRRESLERLRRWFGSYYGRPELAESVCLVGNLDECVSGLGELAEIGADLLILNPMLDIHEQTELLVHDVIPALA